MKATHDFDLNLPRWLYAGDGEGTGEGGGEGGQGAAAGAGGSAGGEGEGSASVDSKIQSAVELATAGLRKNRDEILAEKKDASDQLRVIQGQLETLGGKEGLQKLLEMRERLQKDEMGSLLADGKYDEWFDKRTAALRGDYDQRLQAQGVQLEEANAGRETALQTLAKTLLQTEVDSAALTAEVEKTALEDVRMAAAQVFSYDADMKRHVIKDENGVVLLGKDGQTPMAVLEWLEEQRQPKRHWFPASQSAGANGAHGGAGNSGVAPDAAAVSRMNMTDYKKYREAQGLTGVRHGIPG